MEDILEQIRYYLKQNGDISDIIVSYKLISYFKKMDTFIIDDEYGGDDLYISKECQIGLVIIDDKPYNVICDILLEEDEICFT